MKRFIAFLLSVVLILSVSASVFAESKEELAAKELEKYGILDAKDYLGKISTEDDTQTAYKILNGKNGERFVTMRTRLE